jgi:hypothetical protein
MPCIASGGDVHGSKVEFGGEGVVGRASQREVRLAVFPAFRKRFTVVKLEIVRLLATMASRVDVSAARSIPLEDRAPNTSWDVTGPAMGLGCRPEIRDERRRRFEGRLRLKRRFERRFERRLRLERRLGLRLRFPSMACAVAAFFKRCDEHAQRFQLDFVD